MNRKKARVGYSVSNEAYVIEVFDEQEKEWIMNKMFKCVAANGQEDADFVHFTLVTEILDLIDLGYEVKRSMARDLYAEL